MGAFLPPWGCRFSTFWSPGGSLGRPWETTYLFALIAQAWAWRSFQLYSGHEARYTNRYQSGLDQYHEARYIPSGISLDLIFFGEQRIVGEEKKRVTGGLIVLF